VKLLLALLHPWTWLMAWRDARRSWPRMALFSLSITLGVGALVALGSMCGSMQTTLNEETRTLVGADLVLANNVPPSPAETEFVRQLGGQQASLNSYSSTIYFPDRGIMRLVNIYAASTNFPLYGQLETEPSSALAEFRRGEGVLVSQPLARQLGLKLGDAVRIGYWSSRFVGTVQRMPGDDVSISTLAPRALIAASVLPKVFNSGRKSAFLKQTTNLLERTIGTRFRTLFQLPEQPPVSQILKEHQAEIERFRFDVDTVERRRANFGNSLKDLDAFLSLVAFVALLLGTVGIASAIQVHVQQRLVQVAVLRCLGTPMATTFAIYLAQALTLGLIGSLVGVLVGGTVQMSLPRIFNEVLPFPVKAHFSWPIALRAVAAGVVVSGSFALLPLLAIRRISPLAAIRADYEARPSGPDWARRWVLALIGAIVLGFAVQQTRFWYQGVGFTVGLGVAFLVLATTARSLVWIARRLAFPGLPFELRQGLASLHRPQNRTATLLVSVGLGTFLVLTLQFARSTLLGQLLHPESGNEPDTVLFDIRSRDLDGVEAMLMNLGYPVLERIPLATLRIHCVNDLPIRDWAADRKTNRSHYVPNWVIQQDYHCTWRTNLIESEKLVAGRFVPVMDPKRSVVPITIDENIARKLDVQLGDWIRFDQGGAPVDCEIVGVRKIQEHKLRPSFHFLFPAGGLNSASAMHVITSRAGKTTEAGRLQQSLAQSFPTVSVIDLTQVLETLGDLLSKVGLAIRFLALFTVFTGILVLLGAIVTGRWQRARESILFRTLGATRSQVRRILLVEYALLGLLSAGTGLVLALGAGWGVARFVFAMPFHATVLDVAVALVAVPVLTILGGLVTSRGIANAPPLEILRQEN